MSRTKKKLLAIMLICGAGTLFQTGLVPTSCVQAVGEATLSSVDFCSVFNCTGGSFFNMCDPVWIFVDCLDGTTTP